MVGWVVEGDPVVKGSLVLLHCLCARRSAAVVYLLQDTDGLQAEREYLAQRAAAQRGQEGGGAEDACGGGGLTEWRQHDPCQLARLMGRVCIMSCVPACASWVPLTMPNSLPTKRRHTMQRSF